MKITHPTDTPLVQTPTTKKRFKPLTTCDDSLKVAQQLLQSLPAQQGGEQSCRLMYEGSCQSCCKEPTCHPLWGSNKNIRADMVECGGKRKQFITFYEFPPFIYIKN